MALIEYQLDRVINKVDMAVKRVQLANLSQEPLYVCYSGGKDSKVLRRICEMAEVPFELHYNLTTVDHPPVVRELMNDPAVIVDKPRDKNGKQITMWSLIVQKQMPPTRLCRYCCAELKEKGGQGRICVTGVRKAESVNRSKNGGEIKVLNGKKAKKTMKAEKIEAEYADTPSGGIVMNLDNHENRRMVEQCYRTNKTLINPLIDWTDEDIWEFSRAENIQQSDLYEQNGGAYKRLGCILCPMSTVCNKEREMRDYPQIKEAYIRAFDRMLKNMSNPPQENWTDGEAVFDWWVYGKGKEEVHPNQIVMQEILSELGELL